jgi:hypothetical protein
MKYVVSGVRFSAEDSVGVVGTGASGVGGVVWAQARLIRQSKVRARKNFFMWNSFAK